VTALSVMQWVDRLPNGPSSTAGARNVISKLLLLAMPWECIPVARNPMELVKGSTKRKGNLTIVTPAQSRNLVKSLPEPYKLILLVTGCVA